jgi:hypothetical protein
MDFLVLQLLLAFIYIYIFNIEQGVKVVSKLLFCLVVGKRELISCFYSSRAATYICLTPSLLALK